MKLCFIDIETTGLDSEKDRIWQIAGHIRMNGRITDTFNIICKEGEGRVYQQFKNMLDEHVDKYDKEDKMQLIAYNAPFDTGFIRAMFQRSGNKY